MFRNWIAPVALCATTVGIGPFALSENSPNTPGQNEVALATPSTGPAATFAPQGDPPLLPGAAAQPNFTQPSPAQPFVTQRDGQAPAAIAPRLAQPQFGNTQLPNAPAPLMNSGQRLPCPFGSDQGFACDYESRGPRVADGRFYNAAAQPPVPAGFYCEGGACPWENQFAPQPVRNFLP